MTEALENSTFTTPELAEAIEQAVDALVEAAKKVCEAIKRVWNQICKTFHALWESTFAAISGKSAETGVSHTSPSTPRRSEPERRTSRDSGGL